MDEIISKILGIILSAAASGVVSGVAVWFRMRKKKDKATDLDILVGEIMKLPHGQLKKVLTDEVMAVLAKYSYTE